MRAAPMVVGDIRAKDATEMPLVEDDDVVETLAADRADDALDVGVGVSSRLHRLASGEAQTFRVTHPFHPLRGRTFPLVDCRQTWGEDRVYFHDDSGQLARLPLQWTDVVPDDPTVVVGAGRAHFRYDDLCRFADLLTGLDGPARGRPRRSGVLRK